MCFKCLISLFAKTDEPKQDPEISFLLPFPQCYNNTDNNIIAFFVLGLKTTQFL